MHFGVRESPRETVSTETSLLIKFLKMEKKKKKDHTEQRGLPDRKSERSYILVRSGSSPTADDNTQGDFKSHPKNGQSVRAEGCRAWTRVDHLQQKNSSLMVSGTVSCHRRARRPVTPRVWNAL